MAKYTVVFRDNAIPSLEVNANQIEIDRSGSAYVFMERQVMDNKIYIRFASVPVDVVLYVLREKC